jgi:hypothetical protein
LNPILNISVAGAFSDGSDAVLNFTNNKTYELQNYTSITHGPHFFKFGVVSASMRIPATPRTIS